MPGEKDAALSTATGNLFGQLFPRYTADEYRHSVELFSRRWHANGLPADYFVGKTCLDAGCGGGRYSVAMRALGASTVHGVDLAESSINDARRRSDGTDGLHFRVGSVEALPFEDATFDFVCFSGVLQHTPNPNRALDEIARVLKPGGEMYALVYANGGLRWPLMQLIRPLAQGLGFERIDGAVAAASLSAAKRRTYLDDLFVPKIDFYSWERLQHDLATAGFTNSRRWSRGRLDHEEDLAAYEADLAGLLDLFRAAEKGAGGRDEAVAELCTSIRQLCETTRDIVSQTRRRVADGEMSEEAAMAMIIGQGHHRFLSTRAG